MGTQLRSSIVLAAMLSLVSGAFAGSSGRSMSDPLYWRASLPTAGNTMHKEVFPGIDLIFSGNQNRITARFIVRPHADPASLRLSFPNADDMRLSTEVSMRDRESNTAVRLLEPSVFQVVAGNKVTLPTGYVQHKDGTIGILVQSYDRTKPIIVTLVTRFVPAGASTGKTGEIPIPLSVVPNISATMTDQVIPDSDNDGKATPGETVKYTVVIENTGTMDALDVDFDDTIDPNTTLTAGTVKTTPLAYDETFTILEDTPTAFNLDGNDPDGNSSSNLTFTSTSSPSKGSLGSFANTGQFNADVTYTPNADANNNTAPAGADGFGFKVTDDDANEDYASVTINITPVNDAPTITCGPNQTHNNTDGPAITVPGWGTNITPGPATATDEAGQVVTINVTGNTTPGLFSAGPSVNSTTGDLTYTLSGAAGVSTITLQAQDDGGTSNGGVDVSTSCSFDIQVNGPPIAVNDPNGGLPSNSTPSNDATVAGTDHPYHTALNTQLTVPDGANDLLANDNLGLPAGDISGYGTTGNPIAQTTIGSPTATDQGGTVTVNANGSFTYDPPSATFTGLDQFAYRLQNAAGFSDATVTVAVGLRPSAVADTRTATGNIRINTATIPFSVLTNDAGDQLSVTAFDATSTNGGNVNVSANGEFTYNPPPGFEGTGGSADQFTYTASNGLGNSVGTVGIDVTSMIWFIDNTASAGDGRLTSPFNSLAAFQAVNNGTGNNPAAGDNILIYTGSGSYTGGVTLLDNQKLIGDGSSSTLAAVTGITLAPGSDALPVFSGTDPTIENASGSGITLGSGNTVRGLTVGNTPTGFGYSGGAVGTFSIVEASKTGTGGGINISTSGTVGTVQFDNLSSTNAPSQGINLTSVTGTFTVNAGSISAPTGTGINISNSNLTMSYPGAITKDNAGRLVEISGNTGGTLNFSGNLSNVNAGATGINIENSTAGSFTFSGASKTINTTTGAGIRIDNIAGCTTSFTNGGLTISSTTGTGFRASRGGTVNVSGSSNSINATNGVAMDLDSVDVGMTFASVSSSGSSGAGIQLDFISGSLTMNGGSITGASGTAFDVGGTANNSGGSAVVVYAGNITNTAGRAVLIQELAGGSYTLSGNISHSASAIGIQVSDINNGTTATVTFSGTTKTVSSSSNIGVQLTANPNGTINFTNGGLGITATTGVGFNATGGGTVNVTGTNNTISTTTGIALNAANTTIGSSGLNFRSISAGTTTGSAGVGISLDNTGTSGGFTITGTGTAGSGGTIRNKTGADGSTTAGIGIYLNTTRNVSLAYMQLNDFQNFAVRGTSVTDFQLRNSVISGANGTSAAHDEGSVSFANLLERALFDNVSISGGLEDNIVVTNTSGLLDTMVVQNSTIGLNSTSLGNDGILVESQNAAIVRLAITNNSFLGARGDMVQANALGTSTFDLLIKDNTFNNTHTNIVSGGGGITISGGSASSNITMNYEVSGTTQGSQTFRGARGNAITANFVNGGGSVTGLIKNNDIGNSSFSGSGSTEGSGISVGANVNIVHTVTIDANDIVEVDGFAGIDGLANNASTMNLTVTNNNISGLGGFALAGMYLLVGGAGAGDVAVLCSDVRNNSFNASGVAFASPVYYDQISALAHHNLPQYAGPSGGAAASTAIATYLTGRGNTLTPGAGGSAVDALATSGITGAGTTCP